MAKYQDFFVRHMMVVELGIQVWGGGAIADLTSKAVHGDMLVCQLNN